MFKKLSYYFWYLKVLNSPLRGLKLKFYYGPIKIGTPYFLPRKTVHHPNGTYVFKEVKYFWFNIIPLGWKTKFGNYRFEWNPMISFVFFKKQFVIWIQPNTIDEADSVYWEAFLTYNDTKGDKITRFKQTIRKYSCIWISYQDGKKIETDYYFNILKSKYIELYKKEYPTLRKIYSDSMS